MAVHVATEEHHPDARLYVRIAVILCAFTAVEVIVYYITFIRDANLLAPILLILSAIKFATVVAYYMHLKFDSRIFTSFFVTGLICASFVITALMALFTVLTHSGTPNTTSAIIVQVGAAKPLPNQPYEAAAVSGYDPRDIGNPDNGRTLFVQRGCNGCHIAPNLPGTSTVGPSQEHYAARPTIAGGIKNTPTNTGLWIHDPKALKPGTLMPTLNLSDPEIRDLTAYLFSLK